MNPWSIPSERREPSETCRSLPWDNQPLGIRGWEGRAGVGGGRCGRHGIVGNLWMDFLGIRGTFTGSEANISRDTRW